MLISIIPIGNSKGIRIPKNVLEQLKIEDKVELEIHGKDILIKPVEKKTRSGWAKSFSEMKTKNEDSLLYSEINEEKKFDWEW